MVSMEPDLSRFAAVDRNYSGLIRFFGPNANLGGKLLYAGTLDSASSTLVIAANIAGAASLAACADKAVQRQAIREGMVDFLVTTLDEALRILKNQVRKRETVAVCVAQPAEQLEREMVEIGVLPDLLPSKLSDSAAHSVFMRQGALQIIPVSVPESQILLCWQVAAEAAVWLPKLDDLARESIDAAAGSALRWLRLAPRYLGRAAQNLRLLRCNREFATRFIEQVRESVAQGQIGVPVEIHIESGGQLETHRFPPNAAKVAE
jgi:hypothetical protein